MKRLVGSRGYLCVDQGPVSLGLRPSFDANYGAEQISTSPEKLSDHGKKLRSALFYRLHTLRDELHGRELRGVAEDLDESMARERVANSGSGTGEIQERESQPLIGDR